MRYLLAQGPYLLGAEFSAADLMPDHADALVAEHAKGGDRVAGAASVCCADESSPELEEALTARRTERVELKIGGGATGIGIKVAAAALLSQDLQ